MLYVEIAIKDELGNLVVPIQRGPINQPIVWKALPGSPEVVERPGTDNGAYLLWHYTWQPGITLNLNYRKSK